MLREFLTWWGGQLKALLPVPIQRQLQGSLCLLYLDIEADKITAQARCERRTLQFGDIALDDADRQQALRAFVDKLPKRPDRIVLRFAPGRYLRRDVELPLAAERDLAESLGYQIDQLSPFNADQVWYFSGVSARMPERKLLRAWLTIAPRALARKALHTLYPEAQPVLLQGPQGPLADDEPLQLTFRPPNAGGRAALSGNVALGLLLILVLAGALSLHVRNLLQERDRIDTELRQLRSQATEAADLRDQLTRSRQQIQQLSDLYSAHPPILNLWKDLTERLDDNTWLQRLDVQDEQLRLQGLSSDAASLIQQLEASKLLSEVSFVAPITRDRRTDKDRFNISAKFIPGGRP
jgi:general secretion pathway protein L